MLILQLSTFTFTGTNNADVISTYDLNITYPGNSGFEVLGLSGDDTIRLSIMGRVGVDIAWGGWKHFMSGSAYFSDYAAQYLMVDLAMTRFISR